MAGRRLIIGDVHGHYTELMRALEHARYDDGTDSLVFLGDYINRGDKSREVLDFVIGLNLRQPGRHVFLRGNHEDIVLHCLKGDIKAFHAWLDGMFGLPTLGSYGFDRTRLSTISGRYHIDDRRMKARSACGDFLLRLFPAAHLAFLEKTDLFFRLGTWHLSHAGLMRGKQLESHRPSAFIWGDREWLVSETAEGQPTVVCGHWHQREKPLLIESGRMILAHDERVPIFVYEEMVVVDNTGERTEVPQHLMK